MGQYKEDVPNIDEWCKSAVICIRIRNEVVHKLPDANYYNLNIDGKIDKYSVDDLLKLFKKSWKKINPSIINILGKLKDDDIEGDVVWVRVYMRNYKMWFNDIYSVEIENSDGEQKELDDYPENQYGIEDYEIQVEKDIKNWLIKKGINMANVEIEVYLDWYEEPDD